MPEQTEQTQTARERARAKKLRNEEFLKRHWKIVAPLLVGFLLGLFIVPLFYLSFLEALCLQMGGAGLLFILGKMFTTAFDGAHPAEDETPQ